MPVHKRIRPFNTKETYPEQKLNNDLSQGVVARGTMVFLRGQVSQDLDSREACMSAMPPSKPPRRWKTSRCCWRRPVPRWPMSAASLST
jgi:hypothetical protein